MFEQGENNLITESGNWNIAKVYSHYKIMRPLYESDEYAKIAQTGVTSLNEEIENKLPIDQLKIKGFTWLIDTLLNLISNTSFAIKSSGDRDKMKGFKEELEKARALIPYLTKKIINQRLGTNTIKLISERYDPLLIKVLEIKSGINDPLNRSDLIFIFTESFDPHEYKKKVIEDATTKG